MSADSWPGALQALCRARQMTSSQGAGESQPIDGECGRGWLVCGQLAHEAAQMEPVVVQQVHVAEVKSEDRLCEVRSADKVVLEILAWQDSTRNSF